MHIAYAMAKLPTISGMKHIYGLAAHALVVQMQDLTMPGSHVDVNLHPTKKEVGFLHQDDLLEAVRGAIEQTLLTSNDKYAFACVFPWNLCKCLHEGALTCLRL